MGVTVFRISVGFVVGVLILLGVSLFLSSRALDEQARLAESGDLRGAQVQVERAARLDPFGPLPMSAEGYLELRRGRPQAAVEAFREATKRDPRNYINYVSMGSVQREQLGDPKAAARSFREAIERNPNAYSVRSLLAATLLSSGDLEGAKEQYAWLREKDKATFNDLYTLGRLYLRTGEPAKGAEAFREARDRAQASLGGLRGEERERREELVTSLDLAVADAFVVQRDYEGALEVLRESESEQAPALIALLEVDPERYRESVIENRVD
jgi:tetratricopeptide (TPR) repeat protein